MSDTLTTAQKARILVDGANPATGAIFSTDPSGVVTIDAPDVDGNVFVHGDNAGSVAIRVDQGGQNGTDDVTVTDAPLAVTLDTPVADV